MWHDGVIGTREVRNRIFFISVWFRFRFLKKSQIQFGMSLVRFGHYSYLLFM